MLRELLDDADRAVREALDRGPPELVPEEVGEVVSAGGGIARVRGLLGLGAEELVGFPDAVLGMAVNLDPDELGVVLLGDSPALVAGAEVRALGRPADTPVGEALLGRVIDATGAPLDDGPALPEMERRPIERPAPAIMDRAPVSVPLIEPPPPSSRVSRGWPPTIGIRSG